MKKILYAYIFIFSGVLFAAGNDDVNLEALKEWIATKRAITIEERGGALSISGDVRVEYVAITEQHNGYRNIGAGSFHPLIPSDQFDIEFNFNLDYRTDLTWATVKIEFDNNAGIFNGSFNKVFLERAFFGMRVFETPASTTDIEFGRRFLGYTFDSQIQFGAIMDGILLKYNNSTSTYGDFYFYAAPFVVNEIIAHISFVAEIGLLNIYNTGFYAKYSIIDWDTKGFANDRLDRMHEFVNSQFLLGYRFQNPFFNAVTIAYGAFLINTAARPFELLNNRKDNLAGYVGVSMGEIRKKKDWSLDLNIQIVEPQAIPYLDFSGIGVTNPDGVGLYTLLVDGGGGGSLLENAVASGNYYGLKLSFLYAIEDTITLAQSFAISRPFVSMANKFHYQRYKLELIYAW